MFDVEKKRSFPIEFERKKEILVVVFCLLTIPSLLSVTNKPEAAGTTINKQIHHLHEATPLIRHQATCVKLQRKSPGYDI
jgi:hypothetical protein